MVMSLLLLGGLTRSLLLLCRCAYKSTKSIQYQKFDVYTVAISKDVNNVILIGGKHVLTSIVVLSADSELFVTGTPTPLELTRLSD